MNIKLMFFANLKELAGRGALELEVQEGASVEDLLGRVASEIPALKDVLEKRALFISVNQEMAQKNDILSEGDEVGLLPPFSGG